mgnify:CR=1 FL=1
MRRLRFLVAALLLACCPAGAGAAERSLVVGVEDLEYYPLYAIRDGEYVGAMREIFDAFAIARGYRVTYRPLPIKRLYAELSSGGIDIKLPDNPAWAAEAKAARKVAYSRPIIAYVDGVLVRPAMAMRPVEAFRTLGTVAGFTPTAWQGRIRDGAVTLKENPRVELLLRQTVVGHVDGAYANVAVAEHLLERVLALPGALVFDPALPHTRDHYHLSSVGRPDVVAEFDAWMGDNASLIASIKTQFKAERSVEETVGR